MTKDFTFFKTGNLIIYFFHFGHFEKPGKLK